MNTCSGKIFQWNYKKFTSFQQNKDLDQMTLWPGRNKKTSCFNCLYMACLIFKIFDLFIYNWNKIATTIITLLCLNHLNLSPHWIWILLLRYSVKIFMNTWKVVRRTFWRHYTIIPRFVLLFTGKRKIFYYFTYINYSFPYSVVFVEVII